MKDKMKKSKKAFKIDCSVSELSKLYILYIYIYIYAMVYGVGVNESSR